MITAVECTLMLTACGNSPESGNSSSSVTTDIQTDSSGAETVKIEETVSGDITELESGLSYAEFEGDCRFDKFLSEGGAESDMSVIAFLGKNMLGDIAGSLGGDNFGCSAFSVKDENGYYFGRNFDWYNCDALVVITHPENGYSSICTTNTNFIGIDGLLSDKSLVTAAIYAPLDGMNEKGLCVSVNMIEDNEAVDQNTDKPDITTTTAVRLLLDKAATVDEATELLEQYDMHASKGMTVHFAVADNSGKCVAVEYLNDEMIVTETPVVTNFYFAQGEKNGKGTQQSHERYDILMKTISDTESFDSESVMSALESVSKHHYNEGETTEWSAVFDQKTGEAVYCHRDNSRQTVSKHTLDLKRLTISLAVRELLSSKRHYIAVCLIAAFLTVFGGIVLDMNGWLGKNGSDCTANIIDNVDKFHIISGRKPSNPNWNE